MACKRQNMLRKNQDRRKALLDVVRICLNHETLDEYLAWCGQQGFSENLNKSIQEVYREYDKYKQREAIRALRKFNSRNKLKSLIIKLHSNDIDYSELTSDAQRTICFSFCDTEKPNILRDLYLAICDCSMLLNNVDCINTLAIVSEYSQYWLRPLCDWRPTSKNVYRQLSSLLRYLFCKYRMPEFMDSVWHSGNSISIGWYIHLGLGHNISTAKGVPIKLTRQMAHQYMFAPKFYSAWTALRWAQVQALGGSSEIASAISETRLGREFIGDRFWLTVLHFFINNPMLDRVHYGPIVDYIFNKKYENRRDVHHLTEDCDIGGEQPDFSMKGRTATSLLRQVNDWHYQLGKIGHATVQVWKPSNIIGFRHCEKSITGKNRKTWVIMELLSSKALFAEGYLQNHCVATYDQSCSSGVSSIWTLDLHEGQNSFKLLTIEIRNATRKIIEIRGRHNRRPYDHEMNIVKRWATKAKLSVPGYLYEEDDIINAADDMFEY